MVNTEMYMLFFPQLMAIDVRKLSTSTEDLSGMNSRNPV